MEWTVKNQSERTWTSATCQFAFHLSSLFDFFAPFQQAEKLIYVLVHNNGTYDQHTLVGEMSEKWLRLYK